MALNDELGILIESILDLRARCGDCLIFIVLHLTLYLPLTTQTYTGRFPT